MNIEKLKKKRKFLLMLPLLAMPFTTLAFWALGGGSGKSGNDLTEQRGLNEQLPEAQIEEAPQDKMSLYREAEQDSAQAEHWMASDPHLATMLESETPLTYSADGEAGLVTEEAPLTSNEVKVQQKLTELEALLSQDGLEEPVASAADTSAVDPGLTGDLNRLEEMMVQMTAPAAADPEMAQVNDALDKIMQLQYPELAEAQLQKLSRENAENLYRVSGRRDRRTADYFGGEVSAHSADTVVPSLPHLLQGGAFYDINITAFPQTSAGEVIDAVIPETQTLLSGGEITIRLKEEAMIMGVKIPAGHSLTGKCVLQAGRLHISVPVIRYREHLFPVSLKAHSLDGLEGIPIKGTLGQEAAGEAAERNLQSLSLAGWDPSLGTQAAEAGIQAVSGLLKKRVKLTPITIKAGHPLLLVNEGNR